MLTGGFSLQRTSSFIHDTDMRFSYRLLAIEDAPLVLALWVDPLVVEGRDLHLWLDDSPPF